MSFFFAVIVSIGSICINFCHYRKFLLKPEVTNYLVIDKFCCKQYNVNQFTTYEFNDNRNLHATECNFKLINSITIYSVSINSITINSISINSIFNLKKFTSVIAHHRKCLKHSQFDCSFQIMTIHFH